MTSTEAREIFRLATHWAMLRVRCFAVAQDGYSGPEKLVHRNDQRVGAEKSLDVYLQSVTGADEFYVMGKDPGTYEGYSTILMAARPFPTRLQAEAYCDTVHASYRSFVVQVTGNGSK